MQKYIFVSLVKAGEKMWVSPGSQLYLIFPFPFTLTFSLMNRKEDNLKKKKKKKKVGLEASGNDSLWN